MELDKIPEFEDAERLVQDGEPELIPILAAQELAKLGEQDHYPTGFDVFDGVMHGGIGGGDLVLISGRTGQGKTTFAQTINYHLSQVGIPTLWFSYEIPLKDLWEKFKEMGLRADEFQGYAINRNKSGKMEWVKRKILATVLKHKVQVVFIDHLGFLTPEITEDNAREFDQNYSSYLGQLTRQLKTLAMENNITIVLLAHTRKTKDSLDVEDIAHSVGIPQEADFVFMVERLKANANKSKFARKDDEPEGDVYTPFSRISLQKNRRTGYTKFIKAQLIDGRLQEVPNPIEQKKDPYGDLPHYAK